VRIC